MIVAGILALLADVKSPSGLYRPPDVVVLVLDDVSWFETQENPTPHLDRLAANGVELRQQVPVKEEARATAHEATASDRDEYSGLGGCNGCTVRGVRAGGGM